MEDPAQARAYAAADFATVNQSFVDGFLKAFPGLESGRIADLGCGPADIPIRLARARPGLAIVAVDGSAAMLDLAARVLGGSAVAAPVSIVRAHVPPLPFRAGAFDAVISNSLLHHLPDPAPFWSEILRIARPGAALYVMDLARPESPERARHLVETYSRNEPAILKRDFCNSLHAAFTIDEVRSHLPTPLAHLDCRMASDRHWLLHGIRDA